MDFELRARELHALLSSRKIGDGQKYIETQNPALQSACVNDVGIPYLTYVLSGWGQYSPVAREVARSLTAAYNRGPHSSLYLEDWARLEIAKAWLAFYDRDECQTDSSLKWLSDNECRLGTCNELLATASLIGALSCKRRAEYQEAKRLIRRAIDLYGSAGLTLMVAVAQVSVGWLQMQDGELEDADKTWDVAEAALKASADGDDWTTLANISFSRARRLHRAGEDDAALKAYVETAELYQRRKPFDRNLRRAYCETANLLHRMAGRSDSPRAAKLRESAATALNRVRELLKGDPADARNRIRLHLAEIHQARSAVHPSRAAALRAAKAAFELADERSDTLMKARARLELAEIKFDFAENDENNEEPPRDRVHACRDGIAASQEAATISDNRLKARIHTFLGNLFLEIPFSDVAAARMQLEAAQSTMLHREDKDYVCTNIAKLAARIEQAQKTAKLEKKNVIEVPIQMVFSQKLEYTIQDVEFAIVMQARRFLFDSGRHVLQSKQITVLADALQVERPRITRHFKFPRQALPIANPRDVIFRIGPARMFSYSLERIAQELESAIFLVACAKFKGVKARVQHDLRVGKQRIDRPSGKHKPRHFEEAIQELRRAGWIR